MEGPRRSKQSRVTHDYQKLNDPQCEIVQVLQCDEDIPLDPIEMIYTALVNALSTSDDPLTLKEAQASSDWPKWLKAIEIELEQLKMMGTWELEDAPKDQRPIADKWVFLKKFHKDGMLTKYKAHLVAKGFSQIPSMDFNQTFAPVVCFKTIQTILAEAVWKKWKLQQADVKGAYLNGHLKEKVYMEQPYGFGDGTGKVCQLIKMLYSLKQSGHEWNKELNRKLTKMNFCRFVSDPCAYRHEVEGHIGIMTVWVDGLILFANNDIVMDHMLSDLKTMFQITDLGEPSKIVGIEITIDEKTGTVKLTQTQYIEALL